jgi:hypothetical protein
MKREFRLTYSDGQYKFKETTALGKDFAIDGSSLKFEIKDYYSAFFEDVNEKIEINMINDISGKSAGDNKKTGDHIFKTVKDITDKTCAKLNEEYFAKT